MKQIPLPVTIHLSIRIPLARLLLMTVCKCQYKNAQKVENKNVHFIPLNRPICFPEKLSFLSACMTDLEWIRPILGKRTAIEVLGIGVFCDFPCKTFCDEHVFRAAHVIIRTS